MQYHVVSGHDTDSLAYNVNEKLSQGWVLRGPLIPKSRSINAYCQVMTMGGMSPRRSYSQEEIRKMFEGILRDHQDRSEARVALADIEKNGTVSWDYILEELGLNDGG